VLRRLIKCGLTADIKKCEFSTSKTKYLGIIITPGGLEMDDDKVKALSEWEPPSTRRQLQRFLGFANFYRRFIQGFSTLFPPLVSLTRKDAPFAWTTDCQLAFEALKKAFITAPALRTYDWSLKTVVEVDASNWASGGCLSQVGTIPSRLLQRKALRTRVQLRHLRQGTPRHYQGVRRMASRVGRV
jgi:hypothetical protein